MREQSEKRVTVADLMRDVPVVEIVLALMVWLLSSAASKTKEVAQAPAPSQPTMVVLLVRQ